MSGPWLVFALFVVTLLTSIAIRIDAIARTVIDAVNMAKAEESRELETAERVDAERRIQELAAQTRERDRHA